MLCLVLVRDDQLDVSSMSIRAVTSLMLTLPSWLTSAAGLLMSLLLANRMSIRAVTSLMLTLPSLLTSPGRNWGAGALVVMM